MLKTMVGVFFMLGLAHGARAEDATVPPAGSKLLLEADAAGVQVYVCTPSETGENWVSAGPSASLFGAGGREIGVHGKGPIWTLDDGSGVIGETTATAEAPEPHAVPWLLLKVKEHVGTFGALSNVTYVRRASTKGGVAPADGCDAARRGDIARMRYSAVYQFYGP
ncbi:DUF3455 domain-containing protein [Methylocella sp.]|uniref:DUF3455 domain-containing protein n=1 Tax=Methylocella sp. TaxID=1978226 RepID=UPI003783303D